MNEMSTEASRQKRCATNGYAANVSSPDEKQGEPCLGLGDQSRDGITTNKSKEPHSCRSTLEPLKDSTNTRTSALHQQGVQLEQTYSPVASSFQHEAASALHHDDKNDASSTVQIGAFDENRIVLDKSNKSNEW